MADKPGAENSSPHLRKIVRKRGTLWWTVGFVLLTALLFVALWKIPKWQVAHVVGLTPKDRFDSEDEARKTLATILGGVVVLGGVYFTWRNIRLTQESVATAQKSLVVSQEGQITDRFTKAIEQLGAVDDSGKEKLEVRLGGIYALERIADQSERDYRPIMEVLSTYVRENAPRKPQQVTEDSQASTPPRPLAADIQAILTVLGRRDRKFEQTDQHLDLGSTDVREADLSGADLSGADLFKADLRAAHLDKAHLSRAQFMGADLRGAYLREADLSRAILFKADLSGAQLMGADLRGAFLVLAKLIGAYLNGADLSEADLSMANFGGADLSRANLRGADLSDANCLTQQQIDAAKGDSTTQLPSWLHLPDTWKK